MKKPPTDYILRAMVWQKIVFWRRKPSADEYLKFLNKALMKHPYKSKTQNLNILKKNPTDYILRAMVWQKIVFWRRKPSADEYLKFLNKALMKHSYKSLTNHLTSQRLPLSLEYCPTESWKSVENFAVASFYQNNIPDFPIWRIVAVSSAFSKILT